MESSSERIIKGVLLVVSLVLGGGWLYCWYVNKPSHEAIDLQRELDIANITIDENDCIILEQRSDIENFKKRAHVSEKKLINEVRANILLFETLDSLKTIINQINVQKQNIQELDPYELDAYWRHVYRKQSING